MLLVNFKTTWVELRSLVKLQWLLQYPHLQDVLKWTDMVDRAKFRINRKLPIKIIIMELDLAQIVVTRANVSLVTRKKNRHLDKKDDNLKGEVLCKTE
jgi:predicted P-loop ATPase/GTPase